MSNGTEDNQLIPPGCGMWFAWLFASMLGTALGWVAGWQASFSAPGILVTFALGAVLGLIQGLFRWLVLRSHITGAGWWVLVTALGWTAGFPLGAFLAQRLGLAESGFGLAIGAVAGAILGALQWIYLRGRVTSAGWWVPVSIFAWASSLIFYQPGATWLGTFYGTLSGIVTGVAILWLIYRPVPDKSD